MDDWFSQNAPKAPAAPAPSGDWFAQNGPRTPAAPDEHPSIAQRVAVPVASTVGGIAGGLAGGVPGAFVGGAAGEGYGQLSSHLGDLAPALRDVAQNIVAHPRETLSGFGQGALQGAKDAGIEGGLNALGEGIGKGVSAIAGQLAPGLMRQAANAPLSLAREFPDLSQTLIDHALTVSEGGLAKARTLLSAARSDVGAALADASGRGASVPITAATQGLQKTLDEVVTHSADPVGGLSKLASLEAKIGQGRGAVLSMADADALKRSLQAEARSLYKSMQMGNGSKSVALEAVAKADMAAALNQAIEDAATNVGVTGYRAANASAQDLIGATRAISRRVLQSPGGAVQKAVTELATPAVGGAVLAGGPGAVAAAAATAASRAATTPSNLSRMAIYLSNPAVQSFLRQLPKPALQAIFSLTGATDDSSTGPQR